MRSRLQKLARLAGIDSHIGRPPEPEGAPLSSIRPMEQRSAEEAKRRLEETRKRLKQQIPRPPV